MDARLSTFDVHPSKRRPKTATLACHTGQSCSPPKHENAPSGHASPEKAPECLVRRRLCLAVGQELCSPPPTTYHYLGELAAPPIYGPPTRQPEGLPGGASLIPQFASPLSISNCGHLKGLSREPGASRCIACLSVGGAVRGWPRQAGRLAAGPESPLGHPLMAAGRPSGPWEDYNYKSTVGGSC